MPDIFTPLDELNRMAPHNLLAVILSGRGQTQGGLGQGMGQGQGQAPPSGSGGAAGGQSQGPGPGQSSQGQGQGQGQGMGQQGQGLGMGQGISLGGTGQQQQSSGQQSSSGTTPSGGVYLIAEEPPSGLGTTTGPGVRQLTFPSTATIKVIDKETKLPIPGAAVYSDDYPVGVTDARGKLVTSDLPVGKHVLSVDAVGYDLAEKEIATPAAGRMMQKFNYDFELSYIEMPGEEVLPETPPVTPPTEPTLPETGTGGYTGSGYFGGEGGAPTYQAPTYNAPVYNAPAYPTTPPAQQAPSGPPLPPIDWLQQFLMLPFTTMQRAFSIGPMAQGGRAIAPGKQWRIGEPRKNEFGEWVIPVFRPDGKRDEGKTYYTNDKADAMETYNLYLRDKNKWKR